jgi:hypothetical protein
MKYSAMAVNNEGAILHEIKGNNKKRIVRALRFNYYPPFKIVFTDNKNESTFEINVKR